MNLNETINKRFICTFDIFRQYYFLEREGQKYYINSSIDNFIKENNLTEMKRVEGKYITNIGVGSNQNKPIIFINDSVNYLNSYSKSDIYFICIKDKRDRIISNYVYYVDSRIGTNNNEFINTNITSVNYFSSNSSKLVNTNIDDSNETILLVYGMDISDKIKYYNTKNIKTNSSTSSSPSSIGYNLFIDESNKLGINIDSNTNINKFVIEEDYNEKIDNDIIIEENNSINPLKIEIADDNYQPIGSVLALFKYDNSINSSIKNNYLKMDGSEIPDKPIYKNIRKLLSNGKTSSYNPNISNILYNSCTKPSSTLAYKFCQFFKNLGFNISGTFPPLILTKDVFLKIISELDFVDTNGNKFKGSDTNIEKIDNISVLFPEMNTASNYNDKQSTSLDNTSDGISYGNYNLNNNYKQRTSGISSLMHDYTSGGKIIVHNCNSDFKIGVIKQGSSSKSIDISVYNSGSNYSGNLIYVEFFNRTNSRNIIDQYVIFIPYSTTNTSISLTDFNNIVNSIKNKGYDVILPSNLSSNSSSWSGFNSYEFDLYPINVNNNSSISLFLSVDGICPNYSSRQFNNNGTSQYNTYYSNLASYSYKKSPMSLFDMTFKNYKYYSGYRNFIYNQSSNSYNFNGNDTLKGHFIRYKIDTEGFSRFMKFNCADNDFGDFLDKIIDSCDYKGWPKSDAIVKFPEIGGIDLSSLTSASTSSSSGMTSRNGFSSSQNVKGGTYLFSMTDYNKPRLMDRPDIIGYRQIFTLDSSSGIYVRPEDTVSNRTVLNGQNFMFQNNGSWKSPLHLLSAYDFRGNKIKNAGNTYNSTYLKYMVWNFDNTDSGGLIRVRFFNKYTGKKYLDKLWIDFAGGQNWYDNGMGSNGTGDAGDESSVGLGFDILDPTEDIVTNWSSPDSNKDIVVVIDRIHDRNINMNTNSNTRKDPWDIFDLSYFISYLANDKKINLKYYNDNNDNKVYLPDMTDEGIFLGGGSTSGEFIDQSIPNVRGKMPAVASSTQSYSYAHMIYPWACNWSSGIADVNGIKEPGPFKLYMTSQNELNGSSTKFRGATGASSQDLTSGAINVEFNANNCSDAYKDTNILQPKHFNIEFWIKYK